MKITAPNAQIVARHDWTDGLATFTIRPIGWELPDFVPGQFTNLALPEGDEWDEEGRAIKRAYSIASPPGRAGMDFFVRRVDEGELTPKLFALGPGDAIFLDQKIAGHFTLQSAQDAEELLLVGTGTGVAPYRSMLMMEGLVERFGRVVMMYSDRYAKDLGHVDEFRAMEAQGERFRFLPTVTREEGPWDGLRGRVQQHLKPDAYEELTGKPLTPDRVQVFLCGNPAMIKDVQETLEGIGFAKHKKREPGQLHMEKYW